MAQTQTPSYKQYAGKSIPYTPSGAVYAGDNIVFGTILANSPLDIAANTQGWIDVAGVILGPKDTSTFSAGDSVYWDATGTPVVGTASTGAFTSTASGNTLAGFAVAAQLTGDAQVTVCLTSAKRTATLAGAVTADSLTGDNSTLPIAGLASTQGGSVSVTGGASSTSGNAGGAVTIVGGAGGLTGAGGAVSMTGAAGGATSGTGGAASVVGGAGTGTSAAGGAVSITGGASPGASGTAGAAALDAGAATGGTGAVVNIAGVNALGTYVNRGPLKSIVVGKTYTDLGTNQSSTPTIAQLFGGFMKQVGATGGGTVTLPTGTAISAGMPRTPVAGDSFDCEFVNVSGGQTLTITGQTGSTVRGTATVSSAKTASMKFINTGSNTWDVLVIGGA